MNKAGHASLILFLLIGCSSHRATVVEPFQNSRLSDFGVLEIPNFETTVTGELDQEVLTEIPNQTMQKLQEEGFYREVTRNTEQNDDVLVMEGMVISYEKGSRAKRYLIGLGSGKAYCTVQCTFKNKATGQTLAKVNFDGELSGGFFGGGAKGTAEGVVSAIVDYFKQNY